MLALMFLPILHIGCAVTETETEPETKKPRWVLDPESIKDSSQFLKAVGRGFADTHESALLDAKSEARETISSKIYAYVLESAEAFFVENPEYSPGREIGASKFISDLAGEVSLLSMRRSIEEESWVPEHENAAYVRLSIPVLTIHNLIKDRAVELSRDYGLFDSDIENDAFKEFALFLDDALKNRVARSAEKDVTEADPAEYVSESQPPQWLVKGRSEQFPVANYILSVGMGGTVIESKQNAQRDALRRLTSTVRIKAENISEKVNGGEEEWGGAGSLPTQRLSSLPVEKFNINIADSWYDSIVDVHYALAAVDRDLFARRFLDAALAQIEDWEHLQNSGINQQRAGNFDQALKDLLLSAAFGESALHYCLVAHALQSEDLTKQDLNDKLRNMSLAETYSGLEELLSEFSLVHVEPAELSNYKGINETGIIGVKIVAGSDKQPVPGIPVKIEFIESKGNFEKSGESSVIVETDSKGIAAARVLRHVDDHWAAEGKLRATLAAEEMLSDKKVFGLPDTPSVDFLAEEKAGNDVSVLVSIIDVGAEPAGATHDNVLKVIKNLIEDHPIVSLEEGDLKVSLEFVSAALDGKLPGRFKDILEKYDSDGQVFFLVGTAESEITERRVTSSGEFKFSVCRTAAILVRAGEAPAILATFEAEGRAATTDGEEEALVEASANSAAKISEKLLGYLKVMP